MFIYIFFQIFYLYSINIITRVPVRFSLKSVYCNLIEYYYICVCLFFNLFAATRRRKSLFPINLSKKQEINLLENPTAESIRKIMVPARRQASIKTD